MYLFFLFLYFKLRWRRRRRRRTFGREHQHDRRTGNHQNQTGQEHCVHFVPQVAADCRQQRVDHRRSAEPDKVLCVYPYEHYPFWGEVWSRDLQLGVFGENLTLEGLVETQIHIGDRFRIGDAEVECSQPRQPCYKLNKVFNSSEMAPKVQERGYTGYYLRVIQTGYIQAGDPLTRVETDPRRISVDECNQVMYRDRSNRERLMSILNHPLLSESWKNSLYNRADKLEVKR